MKHFSRTAKDDSVVHGQRVLIVNQKLETAEVLRAVLEPRGLSVNRVRRSADSTIAADNAPQPAVLVVDADDDSLTESGGQKWPGVPMVIIGSLGTAGAEAGGAIDSDRRYLPKPFQYGELIQAIEALVARRAA